MELQVGVKVLLKNSEGKFLLLRRSPEKYTDVAGDWDIVGGRIEPGTPLLDNLKREVKEETGLVLTDEPKLVAAQDILRISSRHVVRLTYIARIDGSPKLDGDHLEYKWFDKEELKNLKELDIYFKDILTRELFNQL